MKSRFAFRHKFADACYIIIIIIIMIIIIIKTLLRSIHRMALYPSKLSRLIYTKKNYKFMMIIYN